jgi:lysophospholipase L1-like esterase
MWKTEAARAGTAAAIGALVLGLAACTAARGETAAGDARSPGAAAKAGSAPPHEPYAALGDSYTSGDGVPDQTGTPAGCARSSNDYPALVGQALGLAAAQVRDVSCSGATIADLSAAQSTGDGVNPAQLAALSAATALVTLGIGGNDVDFAGVLTRCVEVDFIPAMIAHSTDTGATPCEAYYTSGGTNRIERDIAATATRLATALHSIEERAPQARVYVVGYPALLPSSGASCAHSLGITSGDIAFLNSEEQRLNAMLRQQAADAGAAYVDTYGPSVGHDACSDAATRWIEPLAPAAPAAPMHPNARGEQAMADLVVRSVKAG